MLLPNDRLIVGASASADKEYTVTQNTRELVAWRHA
jgi:hypothetical protein